MIVGVQTRDPNKLTFLNRVSTMINMCQLLGEKDLKYNTLKGRLINHGFNPPYTDAQNDARRSKSQTIPSF
jgi:hypothetical protein